MPCLQRSNSSVRLSRIYRHAISVTLTCLALSGSLSAQTFTGGVAATGSGASNLYAALAHNGTGEVYGFWKLQASTSGVHYVLKWNGSAWTQLSTFTAGQMLTNAQGTQDDVALAIDSTGALHIASRVYGPGADLANAPRTIQYGYSADGASWTFTQVYASPASNSSYNTRSPSIAVDGSNHPHVVFRGNDPTNGYNVRYYSFNGTSWSGSMIYSTGSTSYSIDDISLGLDSTGHAHIIFVAETSSSSTSAPYYMTNASGSWSTPERLAADTNNTTTASVSLAVDSSDKIHAIYQDGGRNIFYYTNASGSFSGAQVNGTVTGSINRNSFALNASGNMFFAYNPGTSNSATANYAYRLSGQNSWTTGAVYTNAGDTANTATTVLPVDLTNGNVATMFINSSTSPRYLRYAQATIAAANTAPAFVGATTTLSVNQNASATSITSLLHASDSDSGQTLTWSVTSAPTHGSLSSFASATASSGSSDITPGGTLTYTPTAGYAGSDSFTIQVSDGTATATRTITVTVSDTTAPTVTSIVRQTPSGQALTAGTTSATFRVTFSETVNTPTNANFAVVAVNSSTIVGSITSVTSVSTSVYDVVVAVSSGSGEFRLKVID